MNGLYWVFIQFFLGAPGPKKPTGPTHANPDSEFHIVAAPLPKQIVHLSITCIFVSNITSLIIECDDDQVINKTAQVKDTQAIVVIPCTCEVTADQYVIPRLVRTCANDELPFSLLI